MHRFIVAVVVRPLVNLADFRSISHFNILKAMRPDQRSLCLWEIVKLSRYWHIKYSG